MERNDNKSKERALRTRWTNDQIREVQEMIEAGFQLHDIYSSDEEKNSESDSAFSSDDN